MCNRSYLVSEYQKFIKFYGFTSTETFNCRFQSDKHYIDLKRFDKTKIPNTASNRLVRLFITQTLIYIKMKFQN